MIHALKWLKSTRKVSNNTGMSLLLTIPEVMEQLSVSRTTVYELINRGDFPVVHIGRAVRVRYSDLERYVSNIPA